LLTPEVACRCKLASKTIRLLDKMHCKLGAIGLRVVSDRAPSAALIVRFAWPHAIARKVSDESTVPVCCLRYPNPVLRRRSVCSGAARSNQLRPWASPMALNSVAEHIRKISESLD
jgi:hypothetical protein